MPEFKGNLEKFLVELLITNQTSMAEITAAASKILVYYATLDEIACFPKTHITRGSELLIEANELFQDDQKIS